MKAAAASLRSPDHTLALWVIPLAIASLSLQEMSSFHATEVKSDYV